MPVSTPSNDTLPRTLANAGLPRRVRKVLERALALVSVELDPSLGQMLDEFEQELFRLADLARNPGAESGYMQTLRTFRLNRSDLIPRFMIEVEAGLATLRSPPQTVAPTAADTRASFRNLSLVEDAAMDEGTVLREVASRQEGRATLPLHLLGQRMGVLAGAPAFDAERNPLGPQALCRAIRDAAQTLQVTYDARLLLYRIFDRQVMVKYARVLEQLDELVGADGVLPGLTFVPVRLRATAQNTDEEEDEEEEDPADQSGAARRSGGRGGARRGGGSAGGGAAGSAGGGHGGGGHGGGSTQAGRGSGGGGQAGGGGGGQSGGGGAAQGQGGGPDGAAQGDMHGQPSWVSGAQQRPFTAWMGEPDTSLLNDQDEAASLDTVQQLLSGRRELLDKLRPEQRPKGPRQEISTNDVIRALATLQAQPMSAVAQSQTLQDVKQTLLSQARQQRGQHAALAQKDNDTFELLTMLYGQLEEEIQSDAPAAALVKRLQVPLLRVALQDRAFFVRGRHPARRLLNNVAESAAKWLDKDDFDPQMLLPLQEAVNEVVEKYDGDDHVFVAANAKLEEHMQAQVRKAEVLEKRHVEAARGKEKLEVAKLRATETLAEVIGDKRLGKFTRALLNQAWADVLTLTLLRQGEDSEDWRKQVEATSKIVDACSRGDGEPDPALAAHIEAALAQVGYHADEAGVIAQRLTSSKPEDEDDPASRTELAVKLKARTRLGEDAAKAARPKLPPRTPEEQVRYEQLRVMPFGTWIEFVTNQQGDVVRRRLSWFSPMTDNALFVNQRGQRVSEMSLDSLSRMLVANQARIVTVERGRLVDRAWQAAVAALRSFAGRGDAVATPEPAK